MTFSTELREVLLMLSMNTDDLYEMERRFNETNCNMIEMF